MNEMLLAAFALFVAYLYLPTAWLSGLRPAKPMTRQANHLHCPENKFYIPEDAVLRRHFVSQLRWEIEAALHPRPTDSILQRHYDALVTIKLEQRLADMGCLKPC
ncbi:MULTISPECIES: hypothetical protein [Methylomonas]|uniref:Uncharacterized protein n=2 Tax=Methylomonas TaxID=416 RepID=A0A140E503_9GAMM|nr:MULTISPECIES: hypothetical protein [Methylomonas]AMK75477.1 hypothetical protein JT25_003060 [Methylomonas denitrificans]OAI01892.1 hypothetical protein A1342_21590 [Methylomonas methanica]TCV80009.1 hypothetical protein EDE11_11925 [Methylomonas methanica]